MALRIVAMVDGPELPDVAGVAEELDVVTLAPCGVAIGLPPNAAFAIGAAASMPAAQNAAAACAKT
jgi:hypothetical protein